MSAGLTPALLGAAAWTWLASLLVLRRPFGAALAFLLATARVAVPLAYFAFLDTGQWRLFDDLRYLEEAAELSATGFTPLALLGGGMGELLAVAGGHHFGYYLWNVCAHALFGEHYFSAVFLNVFLTCVAARALFRLFALGGLGAGYSRAAGAFFLLHWDVIAWSSLFNLKDTVVLTLTAWIFAWVLELVTRPRLRPLAGVLGATFLLFFFRWYVPALVLAALGAWGVLHLRGGRRLALLAVGAGLVLAIVLLRGGIPADRLRPGGFPEGALRFAFTPRPWGLQPSYRFLLLPATLHWLCAPFAAWGAVRLWRSHPLLRPVVLYVLVLVAFYALVPRLQGPRHRYQGTFVLAWLQFHGLWTALGEAFARPRLRSSAAGGGAVAAAPAGTYPGGPP